MDVSHLRVKVDSTGIADTSRKLGGLGTTAANTEAKINGLTASIGKLITANTNLSGSTQTATGHVAAQMGAFSNLHTVMGQLASQMMSIVNSANALNNSLHSLNRTSNQTAQGFQRKAHWGGVVVSTLKAMTTAAVAYAGLNLAKNIVESADKWQNMGAKMTVVTHSQQNANRAMEDSFEVAQRLRTPLDGVTQLWSRMSPAMQRMGRSGTDTTRVVQSVATALQLSGATGAEASSAMLQLSQSFNAGRLNGGEFNSIAEAAPLILEAIALKTGRAREELKKMGSDGLITGKMMADALIDIGPKWDQLFDKLPVTVGGALTLLKNRWQKEIGEMGKNTGFNTEIVNAVRTLESMIPAVVNGLGRAFVELMKWIEANRSKLGEIWDQIVGIASDVWGIINGFFGWIGELVGAGEQVSVVAAGLFGIRLVLAAIVDVTKLIAGSFINVGLDIAEFFLMPLALVVKLISVITEKISTFLTYSAEGLKLIGKGEAAAALQGVADKVKGFGEGAEGFMNTAIQLGLKGRAAADKLTEGFRTGNTEVQKLLDSTTKVTKQVTKAKTPWDDKAWGPKSNYKPVDEKAAKAAAKELKAYESVMEDLTVKTREQIELQDRLAKVGLEYDKMGAGAKARLKAEYELEKLKDNAANATHRRHLLEELAAAKELELQEKITERMREHLVADQASLDKATRKVQTLEEEATALENKAAAYGKAKGEIEAMEEAETRAQVQALLNARELSAYGEKLLAQLQAQLVARERLTAAGSTIGALDALKDFDKHLDHKKAEHYAGILSDAFGKVGKSIGKMVESFSKFSRNQDAFAERQKELAIVATKFPEQAAARQRELDHERLQDTVNMYGDMASAAKGFFDEKSKGYKMMEAMEKTFRVFEMALEVQSYAQKMGFLTAFTTAKVSADQAQAASAVTGAAQEVGAKMAVAQANAVSGVANQANGDPYSAFPRMAAMAAIMAALGIGIASISGNSGTMAPESNKGNGTVLGDADAKSKSIENSIKHLSEVDTMTMKYSAAMLSSLQNIEAALAGVANLVLRGGTLNTASNMGLFEGLVGKNKGDPIANMTGSIGLKGLDSLMRNLPLIGGIIGKLQGLWGKTTQEISAAGLFIRGSLEQLMNGQGFQQYADVKTTKTSFFGLSKDTSYSTMFSGVDPEIAKQFGMIFNSFSDAVEQAAGPLGVSLDTIEQRLQGFSLDLGRIDLKGLTGEALQEKLSAVFGAAGDKIAKQALPGFEDFQKVGEGYLETVVRVSTGVEQAGFELEKLGITAVSVTSLLNKQGDVGGELVKQSIMAKEAGTGIGAILEAITGSAADVAEAYKSLTGVRTLMQAVGLGSNLTRDLIRAAGGLDALQSALSAYQDNFFSEAEKHAALASQLGTEFMKLGIAMPVTKDGFKALVNQLNGSGQSSLAMKVLLLAETFAEFADYTDESVQAVEDARSNLTSAYEREKQVLEDVKSRFEDFAKSLHDFHDSLITGELSPLSNTEKYATLKAQYESTKTAAMSGDEGAIAKFQSVAEEFLQFSREYNASGTQYTSDFESVLAATTALEQMSLGKASVAEQQLDALNQQVQGLIDLNESVLSVADAITALHAAMTGTTVSSQAAMAAAALATATEGPAPSASSTPAQSSSDTQALIEEIKALRAEVTSLKEAEARNTASTIAAIYDSNEQNAATVVDGTQDAMSGVSYAPKVKTNLA